MFKKRAFLIPIMASTALFLSGCAANHVSGGLNGDWQGTAKLITPHGEIYSGTTLFNVGYKDGEIYFPESHQGELKGAFSLQDQSLTANAASVGAVFSSNQTIAVPSFSSTTIRSNHNPGKAYFTAEQKVVLLCSIGGNFVTTGWMDWELIGNGLCADARGNTYTLLLERSTTSRQKSN